MAKEIVSRSVGSTRNRVPPGSVTNVSSTMTPMCDLADSARTSTRMLTIPTTGSALAVSKTSRTVDTASSVIHLIPVVNQQEDAKALAVEMPEASEKASAVELMPEAAGLSLRIGTVAAAELVTLLSVALVSNALRPIPMEALVTTGNARNATSPTSLVDLHASSARSRIPMEAVTEVASARASEEVAEEAVVGEAVSVAEVEVVAVVEEVIAVVVAVEVASEVVLGEAVAIGVFREMIQRIRTKRSLSTSRAL